MGRIFNAPPDKAQFVLVTVKRLTPIRKLKADDRNERPWGVYGLSIPSDLEREKETIEEDALDHFHDHVAIAVLDDFDITTQLIEHSGNAPAHTNWMR